MSNLNGHFMYVLSLFLVLCLEYTSGLSLFSHAYTDVGQFIGKIENVKFNNKTNKIVTYLGIPYAAGPSFWYRFRKAEMKAPLNDPYNATYFRPSCLQTGYGETKDETDENCLFLNVYAPVDSVVNPKRKYPVLIVLHSGDFKVGSGNDEAPELLSSFGDVIIVTVNYRLGVFGFLNSGNGYARGNYGLWDQQLAIRWVRYNIASFGGDVTKITLLGSGAGAASAMLQALYPGNRGNFQQVIAISGSSLSPWLLHTENAIEVGKQLGCTKDDKGHVMKDANLIDCISERSITELLRAGMLNHEMGPTIDGDFLLDHPQNILFPTKNNRNTSTSDALDFFQSLNIVVGTNNNDGGRALRSLLASELSVTQFNKFSIKPDDFEQVLIPDFLKSVFRPYEMIYKKPANIRTYEHVKFSVMFQYTNWSDPENSTKLRDNLLKLSTDVNFAIPATQIADAHAYMNRNSSTFLYQFIHRPSFSILEPSWVTGAGHGAERFFMFGFAPRMISRLGLTKSLISPEEKELSRHMMTWISNFAKSGDPNKPLQLSGHRNQRLSWPVYTSDRPYFRISTNMSSVNSTGLRFGEPATSFWLTLIPALLQDGNQTHRSVPNSERGNKNKVYFTAFRIESGSAEAVIVALISAVSLLSFLIIVILCCLCNLLR